MVGFEDGWEEGAFGRGVGAIVGTSILGGVTVGEDDWCVGNVVG